MIFDIYNIGFFKYFSEVLEDADLSNDTKDELKAIMNEVINKYGLDNILK